MDENIDNDIKKRIREVFDNFEDPTADEGWLMLRQKYPEDQAHRRAFAWLWWSAAAVLLLFMSVGLWMYIKNDETEKFSGKKNQHPQSESTASVRDTIAGTEPGHSANPASIVAHNTKAEHSNLQKAPATINSSAAAPGARELASNNRVAQKAYSANAVDSANKAVKLQQNQQLAAAIVNNLPPASKNTKTQLPANQQQPQPPTAGEANSLTPAVVTAEPNQRSKSIDEMFVNTPPAKTDVIKTPEKVHFSVYAATYVNYAKGSNNQFNTGVGFTSEISITKNLKFVTGVSIAQNSLSFDSGVPTSTAQTSFSVPGASNAFSTYSLNAKAVTTATTPVLTNYDANMVSLDIPLNLKYDFNPQKGNLYVLAGLSSGTFINETYTYQYNYPALLSPSLQQIQGETTHSSFDSFYFAKTLNLAVGVGYPVGKNSLVLEPFLKYPLSGLGAQDIRFGAGGINLKFRFQSTKK